MGIKFTNNAVATLASAITNVAVSVSLSTGQGALFPTLSGGDYFYATLYDASGNLEIIKVTARATDTLTVVRAQEGTTGRAYAIGDQLELRITAQGMADITVPSGTAMLFYQAAAPTGWTQVTTLNDYDLRLVSGAGGSTGGTTAYSTVFANQTPTITVGGTTLSTSQIPSHAHDGPVSPYADAGSGGYYTAPAGYGWGLHPSPASTAAFGGGGSHTHGGSSTAITLNVRYANIIICTRN